MRCLHPLTAWQLDTGEIVFYERGKIRRSLQLPCGQCIHCRLERSRQWAVRVMHEASLYDQNSFVTLTYDDSHVPEDYGLRYRDFQLFMKRLRKAFGPSRFYMCGEYGGQFKRPHFHTCLFGVGFPDRVLHSTMQSGSDIYSSAALEQLWPHGFSSIGDVTFESAAYVARYVTEKVTGEAAQKHYERVDGETGEVYSVSPEFTRMSLKPGIGAEWFKRFNKEVYPRDEVVMRGVKMMPPRFYDRLLEKSDPDLSDHMESVRYVKSFKYEADNSPDRLHVQEVVTRARLKFKKRSLE